MKDLRTGQRQSLVKKVVILSRDQHSQEDSFHGDFCLFLLRPIDTIPEEFENWVFFLRLGLPSTLIRHKNEAFRKRSLNWRNFKTPALRFRWDRKQFESHVFRKRRAGYNNHAEFCSNTNPKWPWLLRLDHQSLKGGTQTSRERAPEISLVITAFSNFFGAVWTGGEYLMRFQNENTVFKFLRCSVDAASSNTSDIDVFLFDFLGGSNPLYIKSLHLEHNKQGRISLSRRKATGTFSCIWNEKWLLLVWKPFQHTKNGVSLFGISFFVLEILYLLCKLDKY